MTEITRILDSINWPKRDSDTFTRATIEEKLGVKLPDDYAFFLSNYSGDGLELNKAYFELWGEDQLLSLNDGYEVQYYLPTTVAIGTNGGGEMIGLELDDNKYNVILVPFGTISSKDYVIIIGDSFTDFLVRMDKGEEWFK